MRRAFLGLVLRLFKSVDLTLAERNLFTGAILGNLEALPLRDIIENSDEGILINGHLADRKKLLVLRNAALRAIENPALNLIAEQVIWLAIQRGLHGGDTPEKLSFYRAAIWFGEQMKEHLHILAARGQETPLE